MAQPKDSAVPDNLVGTQAPTPPDGMPRRDLGGPMALQARSLQAPSAKTSSSQTPSLRLAADETAQPEAAPQPEPAKPAPVVAAVPAPKPAAKPEPKPAAPAAQASEAEKPAAEKPAVEKPAARPPVAQVPATEKPATDKPVAKPAEAKPAEKPAGTPVGAPAAAKPAEAQPASPQPASSKPAPPKPAAPANGPKPAAPQPQVPPAPVVATVGGAKLKLRHYMLGLLFLLLAVVPPAAYGTYLYTTAVDQYQSDVGFGSRTQESTSSFDMLGVLGGSGASTKDMDILNHFIESQELVERVDAKLDLAKIWSRHPEDWFFSFDPERPIEDLVTYWNDMVVVSYDSASGLMTLKVFAFTPEDARAIAQAIVEECTSIINEMSKTAQNDTTRYARETLATAEARYRDAQNALTEFRIANHIVDPQTQLTGASQVINSLVQQRAEAQINLDLLTGQVAEGDPRILQLKRRIEVIDNRLNEETNKVGSLGGASDPGYATLIRDYQALTLELEFAQKSFLASQGAYDQAVADALQQTHYLATFLTPTIAQSSTAPDRPLHIFLTFLMGLLAWTGITMIYYALRDRR